MNHDKGSYQIKSDKLLVFGNMGPIGNEWLIGMVKSPPIWRLNYYMNSEEV